MDYDAIGSNINALENKRNGKNNTDNANTFQGKRNSANRSQKIIFANGVHFATTDRTFQAN